MKNIGTWLKTHAKALIAVVLVIAIIGILLFVFTGSEKRAIKKYISAENAGNINKIEKALDIRAAIAWDYGYYVTEDGKEVAGVEFIKNFDKAIESITDEEVELYKNDLQEMYSENSNQRDKYKLLKVVYSTEAADNKDLKKVVCRVKITSPIVEEEINEDTDDEEYFEDENIDDQVDPEDESEVINTEENAIDTEEADTEDESMEDMDEEYNVQDEIEEDEEELEGATEVEPYTGEEYDSEDDMWKKTKQFKREMVEYITFYLYKGKVIGMYYEY